MKNEQTRIWCLQELLERVLATGRLDGHPIRLEVEQEANNVMFRVEPTTSSLKCPTCKRPLEEVKLSELPEYFGLNRGTAHK